MTTRSTGSTPTLDDLGPTEVTLMQQILGSDTGALSLPELLARGERSETELRVYLPHLESYDPPLIPQIELTGTPPKHHPQHYIAVTEAGMEWLRLHDMYDQIGMVYQLYETADLSLPDDYPMTIEEMEESEPRPTPDWLD